MRMLFRAFFAFLFLSHLFATSCLAMECKEEINTATGKNWGFTGYKVEYTISDAEIAETVKKPDGNIYVHFIKPGTVTVGVIFFQKGKPLPPEYYLFHVKGDAVDDTSFEWGTFAGDIIRLTNEERKKAGLKPLKPAFDLSEAAAIRVREAATHYSHERPDGRGFETVLEKIDYKEAGENLQAGSPTPEEAVKQWMNSPTHKENILSASFTEIAVGYIYIKESRYHHYWVQLFLRR